MNITQSLSIPLSGYGVNERKKAELDLLNTKIIDVGHDVEQFQAVVNALNEKSVQFQGFLATASNDKARTLNNRNLIDQIIKNASDLKANSAIALDEISQADVQTKTLLNDTKSLIDKLIYSATIIEKLSDAVVSAKKKIPQISNDVVTSLANAGTDANNAVGLALVALKSTLAAAAANVESEAASALEYTQATELLNVLTVTVKAEGSEKTPADCLRELIYTNYTTACKKYDDTFKANAETIQQLNRANTDLNKAQIKLRSLQLSYAAGNAAILSS